MPFSLLIAIFTAFGLDLGEGSSPLGRLGLRDQLLGMLAIIGAVGVYAFGLGYLVAWQSGRGGLGPKLRHRFAIGARLLDVIGLVGFGWIIHVLRWPDAVRRGLGLADAVLVDEVLILLPFVAMQALGWLGLYRAEQALRSRRSRTGRLRHLALRARQALGLVVPIALVFALGQDLLALYWPGSLQNPWVQLGWLVTMGVLVLVLAPAFIRLAWPTRSLPPGPLRDRLERLSRRFGFRCTDILVWETGGLLVNAGVTGALPVFRYVLLTDALVENLDPRQVEAVFGHEIGHIAHHHLRGFGLFFLGSIGLVALAGEGIDRSLAWIEGPSAWPWGGFGDGATIGLIVQALAFLTCIALHFLLVFGFLSRRFERQADVFGCRAVSCDRPDCPPHADLNASEAAGPPSPTLCPVGIRIFASALADVAALNGMNRESRWAWRHGSIGRRIAFMESLEGQPAVERRFQRSVIRLRWGLAVGLLGSLMLAWRLGALDNLR